MVMIAVGYIYVVCEFFVKSRARALSEPFLRERASISSDETGMWRLLNWSGKKIRINLP